MSSESTTTETKSESHGVKRRDFLKIIGGGAAVATTIGCSSDRVDKLIPYLVQPDHTVPGVSTYYATTCRECSAACGVIAETRDGRTIKLEGNPAHPLNRGALCAKGQAALQGLYNPDRYRTPMVRKGNALVATTWDDAIKLLAQKLGAARSAGQLANAVFINQHESGSFPAFLDQWLAGYGMPAHLSYDGGADHAAMAAHTAAYGVAWPRFDFGATSLVISFGADFLDGWGASVPQQLDWADARAKLTGAPRMIYVGPRRSLTGLNADEWIPAKPGSELAILNAIAGTGGATLDQAATASGVSVATLQKLADEIRAAKPSLILAGATTGNAGDVALAANQLNQSLGNVGTSIRAGASAIAMEGADSLDVVRDAFERMGAGQVPIVFVRGANPVYALQNGLTVNGQRTTAADAFRKVPIRVSFSSYPDETTDLCDLILPDHHPLESWGLVEAVPGTLSLQQPVMEPVFETRQTGDVLLAAAKGDPASAARYQFADWRSYVMSRFPGGQTAMTAALPRGIASGTLPRTAPPTRTVAATNRAPALEGQQGDFYLVVYPHAVLGAGGRGANKPWLQELPDPVSKICWQSWVEMHPLTARRLGIQAGDHVKVETAAGSIEAPAYLYLGIRQDTVAVALGQGHTSYGRYAKDIGVNAYKLLGVGTDAAGGLALTAFKARVTKTGAASDLVTTEGSARQHGRGIGQALIAVAAPGGGIQYRAASGAGRESELGPDGRIEVPADGAPAQRPAGADTAAAHGEGEHGGGEHELPGDADHRFLPGLRSPVANDAQGELGDPRSKDKGMYDPNHWSGMAKRRWAMTIDLARCTGCSACVTACYAENNIPTVGARWQGRALRPGSASDDSGWDTRPGANIIKGREMSWIRIERYFEGGEEGGTEFDTRFVPMMCQHCGNAPCEPVCPVYATYHSPDGLNVQVYNRCVGTRYCSNGCPYKVRYFNWHGYGEPDRRQYAFPEPLHWQLNPDVTVRGKGVMEKCSFCVQRIREAENRATLEHRELRPDEFTTACAQACPSRAITFGDAADDAWTVAQLARDRRAYHVFEELNTYTAVVYLKKVIHQAAAGATAAAPAPAGAPPAAPAAPATRGGAH